MINQTPHKFDWLIFRTIVEEICSEKEFKHNSTANEVFDKTI
jgi:hypothetical protein